MKDRFALFAIVVITSSSLAVGLFGGRRPAAPAPELQPERFMELLQEAVTEVRNNHVGAVKTEQLFFNAIRSMLRTLDPHSTFFDRKEFARLHEEERSRYFGLGITVRRLRPDNGRSVVVEPPAPGSPAAKAGIHAGDVLTRIEGEIVDNLSPEEIKDRLRGARGTWIDITVERLGVRNPLRFRVERDEIPIVTVPYAFEISPGVGYLKIEKFSESTAGELKEKLKSLDSGRLKGLILDFRNNPGGLLSQAIDVADLFLPRGQVIVSTNGRARGSDHLYRTVNLNKILLPMVVLINRQSASASEIVAGALQDHDRALIVGETSFGKGLVQSVFTLDEDTGMALTTARYYTPSGRQIQRDYSGAGIEYFYRDGMPGTAGQARETRLTDGGRLVLGGGGITPDIIEPIREPNRFEALLNSKLVFFDYARRLTLGQVAAASSFPLPLKQDEIGGRKAGTAHAAPRLEITDAILKDFESFLKDRGIDFKPSDISENIDFIRRSILQEALTIAVGREEGYRIAVQSDNQVKRALASLPDVRRLLAPQSRIPLVSKPAEK